MRASEVPSSSELVAHLDTAMDAARHWIQRGVYARPSQGELWENATYFPRILLTRAADNMTQLGYALWRENRTTQDAETRRRIATSAVEWLKVEPALERARHALESLRDTLPGDPGAVPALAQAKDHLDEASVGVRAMLVLLEVGQERDRWPGARVLSLAPEPERDQGLDHDAM